MDELETFEFLLPVSNFDQLEKHEFEQRAPFCIAVTRVCKAEVAQKAKERCARTFDDFQLQAVCMQNEKAGYDQMQQY